MMRVLLILLLLASSAHAATYHVRTDGHDTNCNGSADAAAASAPNCAFLTVQKGINTATTAGDTVTVHAGTYAQNVTSAASGSSGSLITVSAHSSETVHLGKIYITHDYNKFSGFSIHKGGSGGYVGALNIKGDYNQITNCTIDNTQTEAGRNTDIAVQLTGDYNTISGNSFTGPSYYVGSHTGPNNAASLTDSSKTWTESELVGKRVWNQTKGEGSYCTITSNTTTNAVCTLGSGDWDTGDYYLIGNTFFMGININSDGTATGSYNTISSNTFHAMGDVEKIYQIGVGTGNVIDGDEAYDMYWSGYDTVHPDIFQTDAGGSPVSITIKNSYYHDLQGFQLGMTSGYGTVNFWNNIFANINSQGSTGATNPYYGNVTTFYNNTFYRIGPQTGSYHYPTCGGTTCTFKNNIIVATTSDTNSYVGCDASTCTADYNMVCTTAWADRSHSGSKNSTPYDETHKVSCGDALFVSAATNCTTAACNFRLQSGSSAINVGADLSAAFTTDKLGATRTGTWDIGAYEYGTLVGNFHGVSVGGGVSFR